ncbi:MAG: hypothetical protein AAFX99_08010 [Myxococcota bacterium]
MTPKNISKSISLWVGIALVGAVALLAAGAALADDDEASNTPEATPPAPKTVSAAAQDAGRKAFLEVARVLQSPRCMNCHPNGDRPLQTDASIPHAMNISRRSVAAGLPCATCHRTENSEAVGVVGGPPGAPNWHLPPEDMPMVFQGLTPAQLCAQLKDPQTNGHKTLDELLEHVSHDPLVLWGWNPGGNRTQPPLAHAAFVAQFTRWVNSEGACPQ